MPPYRRYYRNWNWKPYNFYKRRRRFRRRRPRRAFQTYRRRRRVRRHRFYNRKLRKLKYLKLKQSQPNSIKKCKIKGYLCLFEAGRGRFSNNYAMYKRSTVPDHEPGGGGWSIQQITLSTLYEENDLLMNFWTQSNHSLPLCRYLGCRLTLFRQPETDYIFTYSITYPQDVTKYYYASLHPMKLLNYNKKIVVASYKTLPHKKKPYKRKFIKPPKTMINKWYFQQNLAKYPLLLFATTACSLTSLYQAHNNINNNATIPCINTKFFKYNNFQYPATSQWGYQPQPNIYLYGILQANIPITATQLNQCTYLGDTKNYFEGTKITTPVTATNTAKTQWGNPFFYHYLDGTNPVFISTSSPDKLFTQENLTKNIAALSSQITIKTEPLVEYIRYNPDADLGDGNIVYWLPNYTNSDNMDPTNDPDLQITNFPLWILMWGWEDFTRKMNKAQNMNQDYTLCFRTKYIQEKLPTYMPISMQFIHGEGPYDVEREHISDQDQKHWYPRFRYQKQTIENLLMTGPATCKSETQQAISAHIKYEFFFKWGGDPATIENINDPISQPTYPTPNLLETANALTHPEQDPRTFIYSWDFRRDFLTQTATKRITNKQIDELNLLSDGRQTSTDVPFQTETKTKTPEEEKEILQAQIQQFQQQNNLLKLRYRQLRQLTMDQ